MSPHPVHVRRARPDDAPRFLALVHELARYEKMEGPTPEAERRLLEDAFGPRPRYDLLLAERQGGEVVGYAVVFETYSTFRARPVLYLEDVYVTPEARGAGAGRALMAHLAREALRRGCPRLAWVVLDWNRDAQAFYERLGARPAQGWLPWLVQDEALERLAASAP